MRTVLYSVCATGIFLGCGTSGRSRPESPRLAAGKLTTCLRDTSGAARCLGPTPELPAIDLSRGVLDPAYAVPHVLPVPPETIELSLADDHWACARDRRGGAACWGGIDPRATEPSAFAPVSLPEPARRVSAGDGGGACAVLVSGAVVCWGDNYSGRAGSDPEHRTVGVTRVARVDDATQVVTGLAHVCVLRRSGRVACWGDNEAGQLGDGTTTARAAAADVVGLTDVVAIASRNLHTCALKRDGSVWCWGMGDSGQLGIPTGPDAEGTATRPVRASIDHLDAIAVGDVHSCGLRGGAVYCWGHNSVGQLGGGQIHTHSSSESNAPARVTAIDDAVELAIGGGHTCVLRSNGEAWCWGNDRFGQTGESSGKPARALP